MKRRSFFARVLGLAVASVVAPELKAKQNAFALACEPQLIEERTWTVNQIRVWYGLPPLPQLDIRIHCDISQFQREIQSAIKTAEDYSNCLPPERSEGLG